MNREFRFFPESASAAAEQVDNLYFFLLAVSVFFTLLIFFLIFGFCIYYRKGSKVDRSPPGHKGVWLLEVTWSLIPLGLTLIMFGWGAQLYFQFTHPPEGCLEFDVVGKQWMWKIRHPTGQQEINTLHLPINTKVRMRMISEDVIHSFYIPGFRVKQDVLPGRYTSMWFEPTKTGEFHLFCAEYCGTSHAEMGGKVIVQTQPEYAAWLKGTTGETNEVAGAALFKKFRCQTCHEGEQKRGPSLVGIADQMVALRDGGTALANDDYLRESILDPSAKVVAGYEPLMPTYRGQLNEQEVLALVDYIKSLSPNGQEQAIEPETPAQETP